ncbi:MAG TPA: glycosyltransferase [Planctomycetaceae bacterium]|nr:glycosyltransferase [Planctomycetaceae bacterium]
MSTAMPETARDPLVSVIIPTFNRRGLVVRAIESALAQTYQNYEIVVQDDGSTDGTADAVAALSGPIDFAWQPNRGLAAARNAAIRRCRGELIALLDSDDAWTTDKLERCVRYLQQQPDVDVVYTPMATVDAEGRVMTGHDKPCKAGWMLDELFENICVHDPAAVFHRRVWERVGGFDESLPVCVGHNFWLRVAVAHKFGVIDEPLAVRTWLKDSLTRAKKARVFRIKAEMLHRFYEEQGGQERLERDRAHRAIAKACFTAGRLSAREGDWAYATRLFFGAVHYRPTLRSRVMYWIADWQRRRRGLARMESRPAA